MTYVVSARMHAELQAWVPDENLRKLFVAAVTPVSTGELPAPRAVMRILTRTDDHPNRNPPLMIRKECR